MNWLAENWVLVLLIGGMLAMHLFGHGHGHGRHKQDKTAKSRVAVKAAPEDSPDSRDTSDHA